MNQPNVPETRAYIHEQCQGSTEIGGQSFEVMSDPLSGVTRTWCNTCNAFGPLTEFAWADTGEKISEYHTRHGARATAFERFLCSRPVFFTVLAVGLLGGFAGGIVLFANSGWGMKLVMIPFTAVVSLIIVFAAQDFFLTKTILWRVCGVRDTRRLK